MKTMLQRTMFLLSLLLSLEAAAAPLSRSVLRSTAPLAPALRSAPKQSVALLRRQASNTSWSASAASRAWIAGQGRLAEGDLPPPPGRRACRTGLAGWSKSTVVLRTLRTLRRHGGTATPVSESATATRTLRRRGICSATASRGR